MSKAKNYYADDFLEKQRSYYANLPEKQRRHFLAMEYERVGRGEQTVSGTSVWLRSTDEAEKVCANCRLRIMKLIIRGREWRAGDEKKRSKQWQTD
jgi:hypothetical protein